MAGSAFGLGMDVHGIHIVSLAARFRVPTRSNTLADGLAEMQVARNSELVTLFCFFFLMGEVSAASLCGPQYDVDQ